MAHLLKLAHQLRQHFLGPWALDRWAVTAMWAAAAALVAGWLLRGRPALPFWHWLVLACLLLGGAGVWTLGHWAARRSYVLFTPEVGRPAPAPHPLQPADKVPLWATGRFEVEGRTALLANLQAFWRTFASAEHAVMAIRHPSRFLLLGRSPEEQPAMWYLFIPAGALEEVTPGRLAFGPSGGPALRVVYRRPPAGKGPGPARETAYLLFDDEPARSRVWADLLR